MYTNTKKSHLLLPFPYPKQSFIGMLYIPIFKQLLSKRQHVGTNNQKVHYEF